MNSYREILAMQSASDGAAQRAEESADRRRVGLGNGDDGYRGIRICILVYVFLLIFEGSLRKWVFPSLTNPLLVVRGPVVAFCYMIAMRNGKFPTGPFVLTSLFLGILSSLAGLFVNPAGDVQRVLMVTAYGFHENFFHLPMIFLIRDAFDRERLRMIGKWILILAPLTALLVFLQYRSGGDAWVNKGAGKDSLQITAGVYGVEKIRPAGFFSYNTGNAAYLALVSAFLLNAMLTKKGIAKPMMIITGMSLAVAGSLSISRTCILSIVLVITAAVFCMFMAPKLATRSVLIGFVFGVLYLIASQFSVLGEAASILQARVEESGGLKEGGLVRFLNDFIEPFTVLDRAGSLGSGLGMGTNAASGLLTGLSGAERTFLLGENEWTRNFLECGVFLGGAYIFWRIVLFIRLLQVSLAALKLQNPLPMLIFAACFLLVLNGPMGVPMTMGFVVLGAGMTLAAAREPDMGNEPEAEVAEVQQQPLARGRSAYAERLHSGRAL